MVFVKALLACGPASYLSKGLKRLVVAIRNLLSVLRWFHLSGNSACSAYPSVCLQRAMPWRWGLVSAGAKAWHPFARVNNWKNALRPSKNNRPATPIRSRLEEGYTLFSCSLNFHRVRAPADFGAITIFRVNSFGAH